MGAFAGAFRLFPFLVARFVPSSSPWPSSRLGLAARFAIRRLGWSWCPACGEELLRPALPFCVVCGECPSLPPVPAPPPPPAAGGFASFGFSGSRSLVAASPCGAAVSAAAAALVRRGVPGASVLVGCASGADALVRAAVPGCRVFAVAGSGRGLLAARSASFVSALAACPAPVLLVAPGRACPAGLVPSARSGACFCGLGSGSWACAAFAAGLGVAVRVVLPAGVVPPASWGSWSLVGGWWVLGARPVQGSLF